MRANYRHALRSYPKEPVAIIGRQNRRSITGNNYWSVVHVLLPGILGALIAFAGLSRLTFLSASAAHRLEPYNLVPGLIGEGALTVWLLLKGSNEQQ